MTIINKDYGGISILMGVYNGADTIEKAIESILNQTYPNFEFIICDDASTDATWEIICRFAQRDKRILCLKNERNMGLGATLNRCFECAKGRYIARQDADDISDVNRLEKTVRYLEKTGAPYVGCGVRVFDDSGVWNYRQFPEVITKHIIAKKNPFFHPTMVFKREVFEQANGYRVAKETRRTEDYDLVMRLAALNLIGRNLQEILYSVYEPYDAYMRHTRLTRWYEICVRIHGLQIMKSPLHDYIYLVKPVIMGCMPRRCIKIIKKLQWNNKQKETRNL